MSVIAFVVPSVTLAVLIYFVLVFNSLVRLKHNVAQAWANIDVLLKQRHDELPKLIETCKAVPDLREAGPRRCRDGAQRGAAGARGG